MTDTSRDRILFEVETSRVLAILAKEIYDSPLALLRENVQNAYDAILMRATLQGTPVADGRIDVRLLGEHLEIVDNGIGMSEDVLRNNFWRAGSSGKHGDLATRAGVVGTFGIGAMANFGVSKSVEVETRAVDSSETLTSAADRATLSIAKECITLARSDDDRLPGTRLTVALDAMYLIDPGKALEYLRSYVRHLPVAVYLNGDLISQEPIEGRYLGRASSLHALGSMNVKKGEYACTVEVQCDSNAVAACRITNLRFAGGGVAGEAVLLQGVKQLMGLRNFFGLAPAPVNGFFDLGGVANFGILHPTAGREALSRDSISHLYNIVDMAEYAISHRLADTALADRSSGFLGYVHQHNKLDWVSNVTIDVMPDRTSLRLADIAGRSSGKGHFYTGRDAEVIATFATPDSPLLCVAQSNPRKAIQIRYLREVARVPEVPDRAMVTAVHEGPMLSFEEAAFLVRITTVLADDYLLPNATVYLADISHNVTVLVQSKGESVDIYLARRMDAIASIVGCYRTAPEVFSGFVKDFVRAHVYQRLAGLIPSSTRQGADALMRILQRNRELYRYESNELGELEPLLADYLSGDKELGEVILAARTSNRPQSVRLRRADVGQLELQMPDVLSSPASSLRGDATTDRFDAMPAVMRPNLECNAKILLATNSYPQLNGFKLFLGLSERAMRREGDFFRFPHTTKVIWAGHRVVYIFSHASRGLSLYYDIELREPLRTPSASGAAIPTTTLFTKDRVFVPVPDELADEFKISEGSKEFYVRFDIVAPSANVEGE